MIPDLVLVSQRVALPGGSLAPAAILVKDGTIQDIAPSEQAAAFQGMTPIYNVGDLTILPGLVDVHVHVNEPGRTDWEGFETATRAAAAGGVTTLVDMPLNSAPVTTTVAALEEKRQAARGKCMVDVGFHGGLVPGNSADIKPLIQAGVLGIKAFLVHSGIDDFPNARLSDLGAAMPLLARHGIPLLVHAEWDTGTPAPSAHGARRYADYLASRPGAWETDAVQKLLALCAEHPSCRLHIVHVSAAECLPLLAQARAGGLPITVETAPHYLYFDAEAVPDGDTRFKCAPPIRERANRDQLWEGLRSGTIDLIASDHSPCPPSMKGLEQGDFGAAWGGIGGLQSGLAAIWTEAQKRGFTLPDVARWMSEQPARSVGLQEAKGAIRVGADADFVVFDPDSADPVTEATQHSRHKLTPYSGQTLRGLVLHTFLRGVLVYDYGAFPASASPPGRLLKGKGSK